jgi:hypothetical protein
VATSGTVAQSNFTILGLVDKAVRRAGKNPAKLSGEMLTVTLASLSILCTALVNEGVNLWCVRKNILNVIANTNQYPLAAGTDDVLNVLYRTLTILTGTPISGTGWIGLQLYTPSVVQNVAGQFTTSGSPTLAIEYSNDGATWTGLVPFGTTAVVPGSNFAADIQNPQVASFWRVRDTSGQNILPSTVTFSKIFNELNMAQLNRDDYVNLPNKFYQGQKALQYWYDKQINPSLYVWPISQNVLDQIVVYQHGQIEDLGVVTNNLAVPQRWYEAIVLQLAVRICLELPPEEAVPGRLEQLMPLADTAQMKAGGTENDGSSWRLTPRIRGYTA